VVGHPREIEDSLRRRDERRKKERDARRERKRETKKRAAEEHKRLVGLRKSELKDKYTEIAEMAGGALDLEQIAALADLDGGFDPAKHDEIMAKLFGDDYYGAEEGEAGEAGWDAGAGDRPGWAGAGIDGLDESGPLRRSKDDDEAVAEEARAAMAGERNLLAEAKGTQHDGLVDGDDGDGIQVDGSQDKQSKKEKKKKKKKLDAATKAAIDELVDAQPEMQDMGYDDFAPDGSRRRFRYRPVVADDYGLSAADILFSDDNDLNKYVSLKRLAPFRERPWVVSESRQRKAVPELRRRAAERMEAAKPRGRRRGGKRGKGGKGGNDEDDGED